MLVSVDKYFSDESKKIMRFSRDIAGKALMSSDIDVRISTERVWHYCKDATYPQLCNAVRGPGSAWDKAYQGDEAVISFDDMEVDNISLGMMKELRNGVFQG